MAYLIGQRGFWRFDLEVTPDTLIPRADTECLVEQALARLPNDRPLRLLDLGTGTGAIALALATERPRANVVAVDLSPGAVAVARRNADIGLPSGLSAIGVTREMIPDLVPHALADLAHFGNPRKATAEEYAQLFIESL